MSQEAVVSKLVFWIVLEKAKTSLLLRLVVKAYYFILYFGKLADKTIKKVFQKLFFSLQKNKKTIRTAQWTEKENYRTKQKNTNRSENKIYENENSTMNADSRKSQEKANRKTIEKMKKKATQSILMKNDEQI